MTSIRALEFFSGIGGLHFGFNASGVEGQVLESFDMNQQANETYKLSFGKHPVSRGIDRLLVKDIEKYNANCWLMSPPCQPYTRGGKLLDDQDNRAKPLLHLLDQLEKMKLPPTYLFLENVKNFETSRSRDRLVRLLNKMGYVFRECLLAPFNFGVPNDRLRYFLMARLRSSFSDEQQQQQLSSGTGDIRSKVFDPETEPIYTNWPFPAFVEDPNKKLNQHPFTLPEIRHFLDKDESQNKEFLLPRQLVLERPNFRFDVLRPSSNRSSCFTKAYGSHHVASGGGLLQTQNMDQQEYDFADSESIANLGLRFLSPTEVARLHVFPLKEECPSDSPFAIKDANSSVTTELQDTLTSIRPFNPRLAQNAEGPFLKFPEKLKAIQRYKLLGNSLNVWVVAELLRAMLFANLAGSPKPVYTIIQEGGKETSEVPTSQKHPIDEEGQESKAEDAEETDHEAKRAKADSS
ncbi:tRNA (cytosine38-C5)-methyltransferase [Entomortierella parvispora]|uniref:tRNA (Cytosine38-C5)-methyltransferase n=1 Tax=Entomortierella parvispora TaxID=205924 RepID=A0A9P3LTE3_9FUNG|nr:tRNA (cytosine38-C5)-methyltransferase [Entomortierella parvispora]